MRQRQTISGMRLRLLALVLALALFWYAVNPAPGPVRRVKEAGEPPDEESREAKTTALSGTVLGFIESDATPSEELRFLVGEETDADDLEWPEVIDL